MADIKFYNAAWCGPCQQMKPAMEQLQKEGYSVEFIDVDEQPTLSEEVGIRGVPTTIINVGGKEAERVVGYEDYDRLKKRIDIYSE